MSGRTPDRDYPSGEAGTPPHEEIHTIGKKAFLVEQIGTWISLGSMSEIVLPGDSEVPQMQSSDTPKKRLGWNYPLKPIKFSLALGEFLYLKVKRLSEQGKWRLLAFSELENIQEPFRSNLHSFLVNIYSYSRAVSEENRDIELKEILRRSLLEGPSFAEWMSGLKARLFQLKCNRQLFSNEISVTYEEITQPKMNCVGDIFRSNQLFYWEPPRPDIVAITQQDPDSVPKFLEEFREATREVLKNPKLLFFKPNNDYASLLTDNTKSAIEGQNWKLGLVKPYVTRTKSKIAFIPRELSESRAAAVEEQGSVLRIRWIDSEVRRIISTDKRCKMDTRVDVLRHQLLDALKERQRFNHITRQKENSQRWSYCRDFKKEGLTKNRELLRIMLEELHARFPTSEAFKTYWFFDSWSFDLDGVTHHAKRGHGLGMANALTTMMQIVIETITKKRMLDRIKICSSFYNNDDAALVLESYEDAAEYSRYDRNVCDGLGLEFKEKSTYIARQHLNFCEQYISEDDVINDKSAYSFDTLHLIMKGINASHARSLAMSMNLIGVPPHIAVDVTGYWGPVLYKNEFRRPRSLGGWFREIRNGVDSSFINLNGLSPVPQMEEAANWAYSETRIDYLPWQNFKDKLTKRAQSYPQEWLISGDHDLYLKKEDTFRAERNIFENVRAWQSFEKRLKINFSKSCSWWARYPTRRRTYSDIYKTECDNRPKEDIIPPIYMRTPTPSYEASLTADVEFENPYRAPDPHIDLVVWRAGKQQESYPRKMGITSQLHLGAKDVPKMKRGSAQRAITLRHLYGTGKVPLKIWNLYLVPSQDTFQYWHNPFAIAGVADAWERNYNSFIPHYVSEKKKELLALRDSFYGRALTWKEWMTIGSLNPADIQMISLLKDSFGKFLTSEDDLDPSIDRFVREFRKYPGYGKFIDSLDNLEGETIINGFVTWVTAIEIIRQDRDKQSRREKDDDVRLYEAQIEKLIHENDIAEEIPAIHEFYEARTYDPINFYEILGEIEVSEPNIENLVDELFESQEDDFPDLSEVVFEETNFEDIIDDFFND